MLIALIIIDKSIFCINTTDIDFILSDIFNNTIEYKN